MVILCLNTTIIMATEGNHRINNPEAAHFMGYAEKPYRDLAELAISLNLPEEHDYLIAKASQAANDEQQVYLANKMQNPEYARSEEELRGRLVSKADLAEFAPLAFDGPSKELKAHFAPGLAWTTLQIYHGNKPNKGTFTTTLQFESSTPKKDGAEGVDYYGLNMGSLMDLIDECRAFKHANPGKSVAHEFVNLIGRYNRTIADASVVFLEKYVDHKREQLVYPSIVE